MKEEKQTYFEKLEEIRGIDEDEQLLLQFYQLMEKTDEKRRTPIDNSSGGECRVNKGDI